MGRSVPISSASWAAGAGCEGLWWAGGCSRAGWGPQGHGGKLQTRALLERDAHGAGMSPLAGAAVLMQKGLLGSPGAQKSAPRVSDN